VIRALPDALALLRERRVLMLAPLGALPSLVAEVAGQPVRGSWWSHPEGQRIYSIATELEDHPEVLAGKLVAGRTAFVHASLWPALLRLTTDAGFRRAAARGLGSPARALLARVQRRGVLRLDGLDPRAVGCRDARALKAAREELEKRLLALGSSEHTPAGRHASLLRSFAAWAPVEALRAGAALDAAAARAALRPYWTLAGSSAEAM
jgi:hypothetical protein